MIAWAVIDKSGNLKWWYQNDNLGTVELEQSVRARMASRFAQTAATLRQM